MTMLPLSRSLAQMSVGPSTCSTAPSCKRVANCVEILCENVPSYILSQDIIGLLGKVPSVESVRSVYRLIAPQLKNTSWLVNVRVSRDCMLEHFELQGIGFRKIAALEPKFAGERILVESRRTLLLSNFFPSSSLDDIKMLFAGFKLRPSSLVEPIAFTESGRHVIGRFADEHEAITAHRQLDGYYIRDRFGSKQFRRLRASLL